MKKRILIPVIALVLCVVLAVGVFAWTDTVKQLESLWK